MERLILQDLEQVRCELDRFMADENAVEAISSAAGIIIEALSGGNKIISCGNGGSMCDATHFAEELTGRYRGDRVSLPAIAINDSAYLSCTANDYSFSGVFSRYVEGVGRSGDVLLAISTSGTSDNVVRAAETAKLKGMKVVALTGPAGNRLASIADVAVCAPSAPHSDRIQEIHIQVIHILIHAIEQGLGMS